MLYTPSHWYIETRLHTGPGAWTLWWNGGTIRRFQKHFRTTYRLMNGALQSYEPYAGGAVNRYVYEFAGMPEDWMRWIEYWMTKNCGNLTTASDHLDLRYRFGSDTYQTFLSVDIEENETAFEQRWGRNHVFLGWRGKVTFVDAAVS